MENELNHFSHDQHPLALQAHKMDAMDQMDKNNCGMCSTPIWGPFYSCGKCDFYLHKVCAELPNQINYPMHSDEHGPLTLGVDSHCSRDSYHCHICDGKRRQFIYKCLKCKFCVDTFCLSASHLIQDKCHSHPLIPLQLPASFYCFICHTKERGVSYKCSTCPFWVHQNCTLIPITVNHSKHNHHLTLSHSIPNILRNTYPFLCDICHGGMSKLEPFYSCDRCKFFIHVRCEISDLHSSRDNNARVNDDLTLLPVNMESMSLGSSFNSSDKNIEHFAHCHLLYLLNGETDKYIYKKVCEACSQPISNDSNPFYGCTQCDYFLHNSCTKLPKMISHPFHSQQLELFALHPHAKLGIFECSFCAQLSNSFGYKCNQCSFVIDVMCSTLYGAVKHREHEHPLIPRLLPSNVCNICNTCNTCNDTKFHYELKCDICNFRICSYCAMLPPSINHRFCRCSKQRLNLSASPIENYNKDYGCDICEESLHPKYWFYHCSNCEHFSHSLCLIRHAGDSNIKYGKRYNLPGHEHVVMLSPFTRDSSPCTYCKASLFKDFSVGFRCKEENCKFKVHLNCAVKSSLSSIDEGEISIVDSTQCT